LRLHIQAPKICQNTVGQQSRFMGRSLSRPVAAQNDPSEEFEGPCRFPTLAVDRRVLDDSGFFRISCKQFNGFKFRESGYQKKKNPHSSNRCMKRFGSKNFRLQRHPALLRHLCDEKGYDAAKLLQLGPVWGRRTAMFYFSRKGFTRRKERLQAARKGGFVSCRGWFESWSLDSPCMRPMCRSCLIRD
jgi:hypothetical protein